MSIAWTAHRSGKPLAFAVIAGPLMLAAVGCRTPDAAVRLEQPQFGGVQSQATLLSRDVIWAFDDASQTARLLARFPLPGAMTGEETYLLYLQWPDGREIVPVDLDADFRAVGFFIQLRGRHAGLTTLKKGYMKISGTSQDTKATRRLKLDVLCEDGTRLAGELLARRNEWAVSRLEKRERPADVQALPPVLKKNASTTDTAQNPVKSK